MSTYIIARNVVIEFDKGGGFVPYLCAVTATFQMNVQTDETMTVGSGYWEHPKLHRAGYTITCEGVTPYPLDPVDGYDSFNLMDAQRQGLNLEYRIVYRGNDGVAVLKNITGKALVVDGNLTAGSEGFLDSSFTLKGYGEPEFFDTLSACAATIATLIYAGQGILFVDINWTGLSGADRIEYSVDGSTRRALVGLSSNGTITIVNGVGMTPGLHTIVAWPICANGDDGASISTTFTKT